MGPTCGVIFAIITTLVVVCVGTKSFVPPYTYDEVKAGLEKANSVSVKVGDYLRSGKTNAERRTEMKNALSSAAREAAPGKPCCLTDNPYKLISKCVTSNTHTSHYKCGPFWWLDCYKKYTRYHSCRKGEDDTTAVEVPPMKDNECPKRDRVCCPGTVWYPNAGRCIDVKEVCEICEECCK